MRRVGVGERRRVFVSGRGEVERAVDQHRLGQEHVGAAVLEAFDADPHHRARTQPGKLDAQLRRRRPHRRAECALTDELQGPEEWVHRLTEDDRDRQHVDGHVGRALFGRGPHHFGGAVIGGLEHERVGLRLHVARFVREAFHRHRDRRAARPSIHCAERDDVALVRPLERPDHDLAVGPARHDRAGILRHGLAEAHLDPRVPGHALFGSSGSSRGDGRRRLVDFARVSGVHAGVGDARVHASVEENSRVVIPACGESRDQRDDDENSKHAMTSRAGRSNGGPPQRSAPRAEMGSGVPPLA